MFVRMYTAAEEESALKHANARYRIIYTDGPFSDEDWKLSTDSHFWLDEHNKPRFPWKGKKE